MVAPESRNGMEIEKAAWVDRKEGEGVEVEKWCAFHGDANGDEGVVHGGATVLGRIVGPRAGDLEVGHVGHLGEGGDKGRDIGCGVEDGRILLEEEVGHLHGSILGLLDVSRHMGRDLDLGLIDEGLLLSGSGIDERRKEGVG